ncbi:HupE/UreJ family protein [Flavobacterium franklandianum]|uniref:HupE/UreJ family protein n=1 Tax=Flavobacterium franklandianum TaxID=2594430 RepID=A0A553CUD5_9FLAO|nr:HupE/UreJ family protein [Flavobacterium franklandianum]TRX24065.1 HupE/UreJ family protein [Flavobacterium franklandianum]TRX25399.1 HupE/UreJ family protein [Flavobacterium franklandianum]
MSEFWNYFEKGLRHILDLSAYDHFLFLIALTIPYAFKDWKRLLLLVTIFTIGHTVALLLSVFGVVIIKVNLVEFLIPITILIIAFFNLFTAGKSSKQESISVIGFVTLFFGIIHGLSFAGHFKTLVGGSPQSKLLPLSEYSLGIETSQIVVVFIVLILSYIVQTFFRFSKRDWTLVMSSFVIGVVLPMIIQSEIWKR